jgi:hypothetical protein
MNPIFANIWTERDQWLSLFLANSSNLIGGNESMLWMPSSILTFPAYHYRLGPESFHPLKILMNSTGENSVARRLCCPPHLPEVPLAWDQMASGQGVQVYDRLAISDATDYMALDALAIQLPMVSPAVPPADLTITAFQRRIKVIRDKRQINLPATSRRGSWIATVFPLSLPFRIIKHG